MTFVRRALLKMYAHRVTGILKCTKMTLVLHALRTNTLKIQVAKVDNSIILYLFNYTLLIYNIDCPAAYPLDPLLSEQD